MPLTRNGCTPAPRDTASRGASLRRPPRRARLTTRPVLPASWDHRSCCPWQARPPMAVVRLPHKRFSLPWRPPARHDHPRGVPAMPVPKSKKNRSRSTRRPLAATPHTAEMLAGRVLSTVKHLGRAQKQKGRADVMITAPSPLRKLWLVYPAHPVYASLFVHDRDRNRKTTRGLNLPHFWSFWVTSSCPDGGHIPAYATLFVAFLLSIYPDHLYSGSLRVLSLPPDRQCPAQCGYEALPAVCCPKTSR
jgi:hypothetical protein